MMVRGENVSRELIITRGEAKMIVKRRVNSGNLIKKIKTRSKSKNRFHCDARERLNLV
jgi:hypothetical protein